MSLAQKHPPRPHPSTSLNQRPQKSTPPKAQKQQRKRNTTNTQKRKPALPQRIPTPALSGEVDDDICPVCDSDCTCALEPATRPRTRATLLVPSKAPRKIPPQTSLHLSDSSSTSDEGETETDSEPTLPFQRRNASEETASVSSNAGGVKMIPRANVLLSSSGSSSESNAEYEENKRSSHAPVGRKGKRFGKGPASGALTPLKAGKGVGKRVGKGKGKFVPQPTEDGESNNDASGYGTADDDSDNMAYLSIEESVAKEYFQKKSPRKLLRKDTNSGKGKGKKVPKSRKSKSKKIPLESYKSEIADVEDAGDNHGRCSRPSPNHLFDISEGEEDTTLESMPTEVPPSLNPGEGEDVISSLAENHDYTELDKCDISEDEAEIRSPMSFFDSDTSSLSSPPPSAIDDTSASNESDLEGNLSTSSISSSISLSSSDGNKTDTDMDSDASLSELVPCPQHYMIASSPDTTEEDLRILAEEERFIIEEEEERIRNTSSWSDDDEDEDEDVVDKLDNDITLAEDMRNTMSGLILDPTNSDDSGSFEIATQMTAIHSQGCSSNATQREAAFTHALNTMHMHLLPKLPGYHPRPSNLIRTTAPAPLSAPNSPPSLSKPRLNFPVHRRSMSSSATASPEAIAAALAAAATAAKAVAAASPKYPSSTIGPWTLKCTVPGCKKVAASRSLPMAATPKTSVKLPPVRTPLHGPPIKIALSDSTNGDVVGPLRASECGLPMEHNLLAGQKPILPGLSDTCPLPASKRRRLSSGTSATAEVPPPGPAPTPLIHPSIRLESAEENPTTPVRDVGTKSPPKIQSERNSLPSTIPSINIIPCIELDEVVHTEQFYSLDDCSENQFTDFLDLSSSQPLSPQQAAHVRALNRWERIPIGTFRRSRRLSAPYLPAAAITAAVKPGKEKDTVLWSAGAGAISDDEADSTAHSTHHHRRRVHRHRLYESSDEDDVPSSFDPFLHRSFHPRVRNSKRIRYRRRNCNPDMFSGTLLDPEDAIAMMNGLGMDIGLGVGLGLDGLEEGMDMEIGMLLLQDCEEGEMEHDRNKQDNTHTHPYYDGETHAHEHTCEIYGYEPNEATFLTDGDANWTRSGRRKGHVPPLPFVPSHLLSTLSLPKTMTVPVPYGMDIEETENVVGVGIGIGMKMSGFEDIDHHHPNVGIMEDGYGSSGDETVSEPPSPKLRAFQAAANTISST